MTIKYRRLLVFPIIVILGGYAGCGGDDADDADGEAGAAGIAGEAGVGGTTGTAGRAEAGTTAAGRASAGEPGTAGTSSAGTATDAGAPAEAGAGGQTQPTAGATGEAGAPGEAGSGGVPGEEPTQPGCPRGAPTGEGLCDQLGFACSYENVQCSCNPADASWECFSTYPECPSSPSDGTACTEDGSACAYGDQGLCICVDPPGGGFNAEWFCDDGLVECPASAPADMASCAEYPRGFACEYPDVNCTCSDDGSWSCNECPLVAPEDGPCTTPGLICEYPADGRMGGAQDCVCSNDNQWVCL